MSQYFSLGCLDCLFGMCGAKPETFAIVHEFTFFTRTCKNSKKNYIVLLCKNFMFS